MKKILLAALFVLPFTVSGQFTVGFHQSNLPFAGFAYEFKDRLRPEIRIGTDNYFEDISIEAVFVYDLINKEDYELYAGAGIRAANDFTGVVIPIGLNIYPLSVKQFGFHLELSPILTESAILRGSWGIRYRFRK
jgi:hypothetical protein